MDDYQPRWLELRLREALSDTPVVLLNGARQTGKSTLARHVGAALGGRYLSLDDASTLAAARNDPSAFVTGHEGLSIIDEVQKAPGLFAAIKAVVDRQRSAGSARRGFDSAQPALGGSFLLTGSADVLLLPNIAESLAGRMEILSLQPLAQGELAGTPPQFIASLYANAPLSPWPLTAVDAATGELESTAAPQERRPPGSGSRVEAATAGREAAGSDASKRLAECISAGGYPEALQRRRAHRRQAWFDSYVSTITQRDVREWSNIADLTALPRLLSLIAARSGSLMNVAELSRACAIPQATLHRYLALLEQSFLLQALPAWHANLGKRLIKAPKCYLIDSGLACALSGVDAQTLTRAPHYGGLLETYILAELRREAAALSPSPRIGHYRSAGGVKVDIVIEDARGQCVAIEVKATHSLGEKHYSGLKDLQAGLGERFACGVVIYGGRERLRFGERLWAVGVG